MARSRLRLICWLAVLPAVLASSAHLVTERSRPAGYLDRDGGATPAGLRSLRIQGSALHGSLRARRPDSIRDVPTGAVLIANPHLSTDAAFVEAVARGSSQGRLGSEGLCAALYARYENDEHEVGIYGLEAASGFDADRREREVRAIWAYNANLGRARVHRAGRVLVVVWNDGISSEVWESVNEALAVRLR